MSWLEFESGQRLGSPEGGVDPAVLRSGWQGRRALVCDPALAAQEHLVALLQGVGLQVRAAESLAEALSWLAEDKPDLIFTELMVPDAEADTVVGQLVAARRTGQIIVHTAWGRRDLVAAAYKAGAVDFLLKPIWPARLAITLLQLLKVESGGILL